jgi:uncharacterized protein
MLHLSLAAVDRGDAHLREQVPPDHPMWNGTAVELASPLEVDLTATDVGEGILVRGTLAATVRQACRRCLEPVERQVREHVDLLFTEPRPGEEEVDDGEVYLLPARGDALDLTDAVREQVLLQVPEFTLCREECRGLCPSCGANLNDGACECVPEQAHSPWDALKNVEFDRP